MSNPIEISAPLEESNNQFYFGAPTTKTVKQGDQVYWKVDVSDGAGDASQVGLLVVFHGSNSEITPPEHGKGERNYPFNVDTAYKSAKDPNDKKQEEFAIEFSTYEKSSWKTNSMQVQPDTSLEQQQKSNSVPLPIVYNYSLLASIPAGNGIVGNSDQSVGDWPNIRTDKGGTKYLIVQCDPEMYVDEC